MKPAIIFGIIVAGLVHADSLSAQVPFMQAVEQIVSASPKVRSVTMSATSEQLQARMSNMLSDPEVEGGYQWGRKDVGNKWEVSVTQSFDWPGVYRARAKSVGYQSEALAALIQDTENDVRAEAAVTLIDYVWAVKRVHVAENILQQMQALEESYQKAFQHGETTILEVNKTKLTRIEASRNHTGALSYLNAVRESARAMAPAIDMDSLLMCITDFPAQQLFTLQQYRDAVTDRDPALRSLSLAADASVSEVTVARRSLMPGFRVGYSHICELGDHFNGISFGLNLPVFSSRKKVSAAAASAQAAGMEYSIARAESMARVYSQVAQAEALAGEIDSYGAVATDQRPVQLLRKALDGGEINLLTYLQEIAYFNDAAMNYLDLQKEYHTVLAGLNRYMMP